MLEGLKRKWNVSGTKMFLILCVFAVTGTLTAFCTKQVTRWMNLSADSSWYYIVKVAMLLFGYQVLILIVSVPFRQFRFFFNYEKKIWRRLGKWLGIKK